LGVPTALHPRHKLSPLLNAETFLRLPERYEQWSKLWNISRSACKVVTPAPLGCACREYRRQDGVRGQLAIQVILTLTDYANETCREITTTQEGLHSTWAGRQDTIAAKESPAFHLTCLATSVTQPFNKPWRCTL